MHAQKEAEKLLYLYAVLVCMRPSRRCRGLTGWRVSIECVAGGFEFAEAFRHHVERALRLTSTRSATHEHSSIHSSDVLVYFGMVTFLTHANHQSPTTNHRR